MAILVTGGAGYIGSHCVAALCARGADVVVVDNLSTGHREALKGGRLYVGDVGDRTFLEGVFRQEQIEAVIHFAAFSLVAESMAVPEKYFRNNCMAGLTLIDTMLKFGVPYLIFSSTAATYGEPDYVPIDEEHPKNPTNAYGESKLIVERMLRWNDSAHGLKYVALRYFNVAGALSDGSIGEDHSPETHLIPLVLATALGQREKLSLFGTDYPTRDGTCVRDYIHVEEMYRAYDGETAFDEAGREVRLYTYREADGAPWGAERAWQVYDFDGRAQGKYLLCWDGRIAALDADWVLTEEQMATAGRALAPA